MNGRIAILSVLMGASLTACGSEQGGFEGNQDGAEAPTENVGSVSNALNIGPQDRQPAAVIIRNYRQVINGLQFKTKDVYAFICDNHQIKLRIKGLFGWGAWQSVGTQFPCDSAPTVGAIHTGETNKSDILGVYWRSDESLIEAWYDQNNGLGVHNLLDVDPSNIPAIDGSPQVTDISDPSKLQLVVRRSANGQIWTIAWMGNGYAAMPVKRANGTIFTTTSNDFYTMYNAGYGREYISIQDTTNSKHIIFARPPATWTNTSYTEWASTPSSTVVRGMLSIGGVHSSLRPNCQSGFALRLEEANLIEASCLDAGGSLTSWEQVTSGQDATLYGAPQLSTNWLFGAQAGKFGNPDLVWLMTADPLIAQGTMPWNASGIVSAMVQIKDGTGYIFWAKNVGGVRHLMVADYASSGDPSSATLTDLGGSNLLY